MWTELQLWTIDGLARDAKHNGNFVLVDSGSFEADGGHQFIEIVYDVLIEAIQWLCYCCFTGLSVPPFEAHFTPCVEIAWRLARDYWGFGYATEAAGAARDYGFAHQGLNQIVSFTVPGNQRSRNVMERIGMTRSPDDDFQHPLLPQSHPLRLHVLYRIARPAHFDA
jgi:hypothetical protein